MRAFFWTNMPLIGGLSYWLAGGSGTIAAVAVAVIMTVFGLMSGLQSHFRAQRRQAALDAYADREIARSVALHKR
jgi:hypothetical protein